MISIAIASDHAGFLLKKRIIEYLIEKGLEVADFGTDSELSTDYPDYAHPLSESVARGDNPLGILICGSGNGVCMTANKHSHIRAALCWNEELASLARKHNNANVICLPSRFIDEETALKIVESFLSADFEDGRHQKRVDKISC